MASNFGQLIVYLRDTMTIVSSVPLSGPVLTIGRDPGNMLVLELQPTSRKHAELRLENQELLLTDVGSTAGTFINGERLLPNQPRHVAPGSAIQIGPYVLVYQAAEQPAAAGAPPAEPASAPAAGAGAPPAEPASAPTAEAKRVEPPRPAQTLPDLAELARAVPPEETMPAPPRRDVALPVWPPLLPERDHDSRYLRYLPILFQDNEFLGRYLLIFESIWELLEYRQDHIDMYFDPHTCPASFLTWLAGWLGLALNHHWPEPRRRRLLAEAMELYRWRGTRYGLSRMIEVCTDLTPDIADLSSPADESAAQPFVFRIRVSIPPESSVDRGFIEDLVRMHKPAYAGYFLEILP